MNRQVPKRHTAKPLVLVVDDDPAIRKIVTRLLEMNDFAVYCCANGSEALNVYGEQQPDLIILDVRMPLVDGLTVCQEIRAESTVPIIMLTGLDDQGDVAAALELGADDYVRKPFGTSELLARVRAVLRRTGEVSELDPGVISAGSITLDPVQHIVRRDDTEVMLTRTEYNLLHYLLSNPNRVLTHDQILEKVWGPDYVGSHHILRVCISRMRQKLGDADPLALEALSGVGYRLRLIA